MRHLFRSLWIILVTVFQVGILLAQEPVASPTPSITATPDTARPRIIRIWWSDDLYPLENPTALDWLEEQVAAFNTTYPAYQIEIRIKAHEGQGNLLSTLIAAQPVAPSVIPDMVLLPRRDLLQAARSGIIRPMDNWLPDTLRQALLAKVIELGKVDNILYGLPYAINIQHSVALSAAGESPPTLEQLLENGGRYYLPAVPIANQAVNDVLLAQYLQTGGRLVDVDNGSIPILDEQPLLEVLTFYAEGVDAGIFSDNLLDFSRPPDYWLTLPQEENSLALLTSDLYLRETQRDLRVYPLPNPDGTSFILLDGWVWGLTTTDPNQQAGALAWLEWMMRIENQGEFTERLGVLPSGRSALRVGSYTEYAAEIEPWFAQGVVLPLEARNNPAAEELQKAFAAVLNGTSAEAAARAALAALSTTN
jgi:ABC-type glycerol-3-phosphate transport system substrate-binding protein